MSLHDDLLDFVSDLALSVRAAALDRQYAADVRAETAKRLARLGDDYADALLLEGMIAEDRRRVQNAEARVRGEAALARRLLLDRLPARIGSTATGVEEILADLAAAMSAGDESIAANAVSVSAVSATVAGNGWIEDESGTPGQVTVDQHAVADGRLRVVFDGSSFAVWRAVGDAPARRLGRATVGQAFTGGGVRFTVRLPDLAITGDGEGQIAAFAPTGLLLDGTTDATGTIHLSVVDESGSFRIDCFADPGRTALVAHTASFTAAGSLALIADDDSGLGGTVTVAEPAGGFGANAGIAALVPVPFAAGDAFAFTTDSDDAGRFQSFLRDHFDAVLPAVGGGAETLPDSLAD